MFRLFFSVVFIFFLLSCKKDKNNITPQDSSNCPLVSTFSSDPDYIPHKKNNYWDYCYGRATSSYNVLGGRDARVVRDTVIQNKKYFDIGFGYPSVHPTGNVSYMDKYFIDSLGSYFCTSQFNYYADTILLIKPDAVNGDTIYNNPAKHVKVVLINNNATFKFIPHCYYIKVFRVRYPSLTPYVTEHYYRQGLGELCFGSDLLSDFNIN